MLDEIPVRKFRARMLLRRSEHADDLVGIDHSALAHAHNLLLVFSERTHGLHLVRGTECDEHSPSRRSRDANRHIAQLTSSSTGDAGANDDLFETQTFDRRRQAAHHFTKFFAIKCEWLPHVEKYAVPVEALIHWPVSLEDADGGDCLRQHAFQMRQRDDATGLIASRRY